MVPNSEVDSFSFNSTDSFKDWVKPKSNTTKDDNFDELVRIIDFHYDNEGGNLVGLQKARIDLLKKTTDELLIRRAVVSSQYGQDENLGLQGAFEL